MGDDRWTVRLSPAQSRACYDHADEVIEEDERLGLTDEFQHPRYPMRDVKASGFGGELAASHALGLTLHWELFGSLRGVRPKRPDMGLRTDAKLSERGGWLSVSRKQRSDKTYVSPSEFAYLHIVGWMPTYHLFGWVEGAHLMRPLYEGTSHERPVWRMSENELYAMEDFPEDG